VHAHGALKTLAASPTNIAKKAHKEGTTLKEAAPALGYVRADTMAETTEGIMRAIRIAITGATLVICLPPAHAQDAVPIHPALHDRFYFGVGAFVPKTSTSAQLDSTTLGAGANIDFEQALGITTQKTVPDIFARFRFTDRWRVEAEYFQLNRRGDQATQNQIQWGDVTFPVNTQIQSKFNFSDI